MVDIYEIELKEHLDDQWADRFDELVISHRENGTTLLTGPIADQAALHGLLLKVRNLGLTLLSVVRIGSGSPYVRE
jgi:hypothetical protein